MRRVISEDAMRRGLARMDEEQSAKWLRLVQRQFARSDWTRPDYQGCQMIEDRLRLQGWSRERRVVLVRQAHLRECGAPKPENQWTDASGAGRYAGV